MFTEIPKTCFSCKQEKKVKVPTAGYNKWKAGAHIQVAMPMVSVDDRELLISGICGPCFDKATAEVEEPTEEDLE